MSNVGKKRYISTKFRDDGFVVNLDPIEKLLFLYFLTNPLTNVAGIYEISMRRISFDTGIDKDIILKIIERFTKKNKLYYIDGFIILPNSHKHQNLDNIKIKKGIENVIDGLPKSLTDKIGPIYDSYMTYVGLRNNSDLDFDLDSDLDMDGKKNPPPQKNKYLDYVYLTNEEYNKLINEYGKRNTELYIEKANNYAHQIGIRKFNSKYKSHYHTILNWYRRDGIKKIEKIEIEPSQDNFRDTFK